MTLASPLRLCVLLAVALAGCTQPQRPYTFQASPGPESVLDTLVRALVSAGQPPESVEPDLGILRTRWEQTQPCYQTPSQQQGALMRRFITTVAPTASGSNIVTVTMEAQCCEAQGERRHGGLRPGSCLAVNEILESHQNEVNALGSTLQQAMDNAAK
ncbi:hypothetical protein [Stigmatella hybrida]|uniref:hypothetical protein n=1 Tax=Stigmatella hybrida TaxID=394097 RepID=UPI001CDAA886|nr:hypothetical protein [Stigmatella hybrida]